ncbi:hypothetical protein ALC53_12480 [Atta colombica]|uniref:Uncharacterized protein n=1 Tax=Atta colombica TaxID=520822 RepID=A0A195AYR9_9HYME|nr:hypothetical protein ALC53_12480 [Atta colombica]
MQPRLPLLEREDEGKAEERAWRLFLSTMEWRVRRGTKRTRESQEVEEVGGGGR